MGICRSRDSEEDRSLLVVPGIQLNSLAVEEMFEELPKIELKLETVVLFAVCCCERREETPLSFLQSIIWF